MLHSSHLFFKLQFPLGLQIQQILHVLYGAQVGSFLFLQLLSVQRGPPLYFFLVERDHLILLDQSPGNASGGGGDSRNAENGERGLL
jgi:hypothetical protein